MTTYRLPDELGGREVEVLRGFARPDDRIDVRVPGVVGVITLDSAGVLVVVPPPLPEEPTEQGWYLATTHVDGFTEPLERRNDGWYVWRTGRLHGSWSSVWGEDSWVESVTITRLVPAPEPVTLPWAHTDSFGDRLEISKPDNVGNVTVRAIASEGDGVITVVVPAAKLFGTAADEADRRVSDVG